MMEDTFAALVAIVSGVVGYAYKNERARSSDKERLSRIETKIDLIMDYFHLEPKKQ